MIVLCLVAATINAVHFWQDEKSLGNLKCKQLGTISLEGAKMEKDDKNSCKFNVRTKAGKV